MERLGTSLLEMQGQVELEKLRDLLRAGLLTRRGRSLQSRRFFQRQDLVKGARQLGERFFMEEPGGGGEESAWCAKNRSNSRGKPLRWCEVHAGNYLTCLRKLSTRNSLVPMSKLSQQCPFV